MTSDAAVAVGSSSVRFVTEAKTFTVAGLSSRKEPKQTIPLATIGA
jgi:hypothetical protein